MRFAFAVFVFTLPALAGEFAILSSGARLRIDRHEVSDHITRLYSQTGVTELPNGAIQAFETDDAPVATPAPVSVREVKPVPPVPVSTDPKILIREAAQRSGLPASFVESVARAESAFRPDAISSKGAIGVMQLMPETARSLGADPHNMEQNIEAGARLLRELLVKYDGDVVKALAAYNAGPAAVDRFGGLPPYDETRRYVNRVIGYYQESPAR
jgi:soluble lytic murein transglycosylase-like protein